MMLRQLLINLFINQRGTTHVKSKLIMVYYVTVITLTVCLRVLHAVFDDNEVHFFMLSTSFRC